PSPPLLRVGAAACCLFSDSGPAAWPLGEPISFSSQPDHSRCSSYLPFSAPRSRASRTRSRATSSPGSDTPCASARSCPPASTARIQNALNRALASLRHQSGGADGAATNSQPPLLPYNMSLEMVARSPAGGDPLSLSRSACQDLVVRGVSAVLAFPRSREELIQVEFLSSFLEIPFISIL
ncbi:unnamed protein product, partial [Tetraodon nigroviridis]